MFSKTLLAAAPLLSLALAELDHPALTSNLDYLHDGNAGALASVSATSDKWDGSTVPSDCKGFAEDQKLNAADIETYNVTYSDCADPWVLCRHKDTPVDLNTIISVFGQVPVGMRDWVKHFMTMPADGGSAFNSGGNVVFFADASTNVDVMLHESGHSLDGQGAMAGGPGYSDSSVWTDAYAADPNVPDDYARTNQAENFAQNTVVSVYDKNVAGGFAGVQSNWAALQHQFGVLERDAGSQIVQGGKCNRHLEPSAPVPVSGSSRLVKMEAPAKGSFFKGQYDNVVEPNREFSTKGKCSFGH